MRDLVTLIVGALLVVAVIYGFSLYTSHRLPTGEPSSSSALVGSPAPDFEGDFAVNGVPVKLSSFRGKVVLVDFWAVWCKPCRDTFPHLRQWDKQFKSQGLEIVGLTMYNMPPSEIGKEQASLKDFARQHQLSHLLMTLPDPSFREICNAYNVEGFPTVVLIDRKGIVRLHLVGGGERNAQAIESEIKELLADNS
jgi:thiol-disulfide isomerase/thioredoxin